MLFRKKIDRSCSYCTHGTKIENEQVLCIKHGVVSACYSCHGFSYDPCKRIPHKQKALNFSQFKDEDFKL